LQEVGEDAKKKEGSMAGPSPLWLGDELEFWPEKTMGAPMRYETTLFVFFLKTRGAPMRYKTTLFIFLLKTYGDSREV
jgi:hypothetical protein